MITNDHHEFYRRRVEKSTKVATHEYREEGKYPILYIIAFDSNLNRYRPKYLDPWGSFSYHSHGKDFDEKRLRELKLIKK